MKQILILLIAIICLSAVSYSQTEKTVGSGGNYATLKAAFDAINSGTISGAITLKVVSSISDNNSAVLNASGTGLANYTSILIFPTGSGYMLSGSIAGPMIHLNGADNVQIDGRVDATGSGKSLVISNSNSGTGSSTLRFSNSAENNIVKYCVVKGSGTNSVSGIVFFSSSTSGNGNDNNLIDHNDITSETSGRPSNAVFSSGTSGRENSSNIISNNNIYNFFRTSSNSSGISIYNNSFNWIIDGNSLYETTTLVPTNANAYYAIQIGAPGVHTITNNYIGGSAPQCGGSPWTMNSNSGHSFYVIAINGNATSPVVVQHNTIQNIDYTTVHRNPWDGIYIGSGQASITDNIIGAATGTGSIVITIPNASATATLVAGVVTAINVVGGGSGFTTAPSVSFSQSGSTVAATATAKISGGVVTSVDVVTGGSGYTSVPTVMFTAADYATTHGIRHVTLAPVTISNNQIGSIITRGSSAFSHCFEGIVISGQAPSITITNNTIGSLTTVNSIEAASTANSSLCKQDMRGIYLNAAVTAATINGNIIANMHNAYLGTSGSRTDAIATSGGSNTIQNNVIKNLVADASSVLLKGIQNSITASGTNQVVTGNKVSDLFNTSATGAVVVTGIQYSAPITLSNQVSSNFVYNISAASSSVSTEIDGIVIGGGVVTCANNIISIGAGLNTGYRVYGIYDNSSTVASNNSFLYFNTVYVTGTVASGVTSSTGAIWNSNNNYTRNYRNNILVNTRSGGTTGKHYAIRLSGPSGLTIDFNNYWISGGGTIGTISGTDKSTLALWKVATGQDNSSLNVDPVFTNAGGADPFDFSAAAGMPAVTGTGISVDYHAVTRPVSPKMGALEINNFVWVGAVSSDFGTAANWAGGIVPTEDADISFSATPLNNCVLDQNRALDDITNAQSTYKLVTNGKQLIIKGVLYFTNAAQIDASQASSELVFAGAVAQNIPSGAIYNNIIPLLTIDNAAGLTLQSDMTIGERLTLNNGALSWGSHVLTINGDIQLSTGSLNGGNTSDLIFGGTVASVMPAVVLRHLTINKTNGVSMSGQATVSGTLTLSAGNFNLAGSSLTLSGPSPVRTNGKIDASAASSTIIFDNASAVTLPAALFVGAITNMTITGSGGITAGEDMTINGILNLAASNPSAVQGLLEMTIDYTGYPGLTNTDYLNSHILNMGANAITTGIGDVTGTIKRVGVLENTPYTFGNQFTRFTLSSGVMPDALLLTVTIGHTPLGNPDAIKRTYEMVMEVPEGFTSTSHVAANFHYLDSELTSSIAPFHVNSESKMVTMDYDIDGGYAVPDEHGRSSYDFTNNFIGMSNIPISYFIKKTGHMWRTLFQLKDFNSGYYTWTGSISSDWGSSINWSPVGVPSDLSHVIIPDAATTPNDPILPAGVTINTLTIQQGGVLNMGSETLTIKNSLSGGWEDQNPLGNDPGTSTVVFTMPGTTLSGTSRFYNVIVADGADITNQAGSLMKIANAITRQGTGKWYADLFDATIEYNGNSQSVITPDGTPNYHTLVLSGSGTKTIPADLAELHGDLYLAGAVSVSATRSMTIGGSLILETGSVFSTCNFDHVIKGNIENSGTIIPSSGYSITMQGNLPQSILGDSVSRFSQLLIRNNSGVFLNSDVTVAEQLAFQEGVLTVGSATLTLNGTWSRVSGKLDVSAVSSLVFGGTTPITIRDTMFETTPTVANLTFQNSGGVLLKTDFSVVNSLSILNGALEIATGTTVTGLGDFVNGSSVDFINNGVLYLQGDISNDQASMEPGTGTVYLNGTITQAVSGSHPFVVNDLQTDNAAGVYLENDLFVSGTHTFTSGIITSSAAPHYLIYDTAAAYSGFSDVAHCNGWVKKLGHADFIFPVGNGAVGRSILVAGLSGNSEINVYYNRPTTPYSSQLSDSLLLVIPSEYWTLQKISGTSGYVTLNWDHAKVAFPQLEIQDIRVAAYDGLHWRNIGGAASGDVAASGTITSALSSNLNTIYTLGSISYVLPVRLISFTAGKNAGSVDLIWKIDQEQGVAHYELQKSSNGQSFDMINVQLSRQLNGLQSYSYSDKLLESNTVFYRVKIYLTSGNVIYSPVLAVEVNARNGQLRLLSNPVQGSIQVSANGPTAGLYSYSIVNANGQVLQKGIMNINGTGIYSITLNGFITRGSYYFEIHSSRFALRKLILVN